MRAAVAMGVVLAAATARAAAQTASPRPDRAVVHDVIPEDPVMSSFGVILREVVTLPKSEPTPVPVDKRLARQARINHLGAIPDGTHRRFVPDLNGTLYLLDHDTLVAYLDVKAAVGPNFFSGRGLGSGFGFVAFHPEFKTNGKLYTVHTEAIAALETITPDLTAQPHAVVHGVVSEWTADDPSAMTFSGRHRELLRLGFSSYVHGIQQIDFNPTARPGDADYGLLYIAVGDGGLGVSTNGPQDLGVPPGKILRIDPAGSTSSNGKYGVPRANPFLARAGALGEIFAYGMRDPHRFSWDAGATHRMFLAHIGEKHVEAIYDVRAGDNLGWSEREGPLAFDREERCHLYALPPDDASNGYVYPVVAYDHDAPPGHSCADDVGHAVSGGFVYRGKAIPALEGKYLFGDIVDGRVMYAEAREMRRGSARAAIHELAVFDERGRELTLALAAGDSRVDLRFGEDADGEAYLLSKANGKIWKVVGTRRVPRSSVVLPSVLPDVVARYDFEHPAAPDGGAELDQGPSGTTIALINGGRRMRVPDGAYPGSRTSLQLRQLHPSVAGNDDWKAGVYADAGVHSLSGFNAARGATVMGWFKLTGEAPAPNSATPDPGDRYDAAGLAGILSGDSDGHAVRALLELMTVRGELRLVALGRRLDAGRSQTFAASEHWARLLPRNVWVFLAATFDFDTGLIALYKDGKPLPGFYADSSDPWAVGDSASHRASATDPTGIKIGGSFPQNTAERNACNCRVDDLFFIRRALTPLEVNQQYRRMTAVR